MDMYDYKRLYKFKPDSNIDEFGVDHSDFSLRDELKYNFNIAEQQANNELLPQNNMPSNYKLGTLSGEFESRGNPAAIGTDNAGGPSYGAYQIATTPGTFNKYLEFLSQNNNYQEFANALNQAGGNIGAKERSDEFVKLWQTLSQNPRFNESQKQFIINTHLNPLLNNIEDGEILNLNNRHPVIKDALYSASVQHCGAQKIINNALSQLRNKYGTNTNSISDKELLEAIYNNRINYVQSLPESQYPGDGKITHQEKMNIINNRYPAELQKALKFLEEYYRLFD